MFNSPRFYYNFTEVTITTPPLTRILDRLIGRGISLRGDGNLDIISNHFMSLKGGKSLMVVLQVEGSIIVLKEAPLQIQGGGDDAVIIFGINRLGVFGRGI